MHRIGLCLLVVLALPVVVFEVAFLVDWWLHARRSAANRHSDGGLLRRG